MAVGVLLLLLTLAEPGCDTPAQGGPDSLQIVLSDRDGVFVADWRGRNLEPKQLVDFTGVLLLLTGYTSAVGDTIAVVGRAGPGRTMIYLVDRRTGEYHPTFGNDEGSSIHGIAIGPRKQSIAFLSYARGQGPPATGSTPPPWAHRDIFLYDLANQRATPVIRNRAYEFLSWTPDAEKITYSTWEGWIESVVLKDQRVERLVQGKAPAWAPDGMKLAYRQDNMVFTYDPARGTSQMVHRRRSWQRPILGALYWSPDGRYLSFNAGWDLLGLRFDRCVVVEVASGNTFTVRLGAEGSYCGPWLAKRK